MGYQKYLLEERLQNSLWTQIQTAVQQSRSGIQSQTSQVMEALRTFTRDAALEREGQVTRNPASEDEALCALFPQKITSFFPEHVAQQLLQDQAQALRALETMEQCLLEDIEDEDIEEDPFLGDVAAERNLMDRVSHNEGDTTVEEQLKLSKTDDWTSTDSFSFITRGFNTELRRARGPRSGNASNQVLDETLLDAIDQDKTSILLERNKFLSDSINNLANTYFETSDYQDEDFPTADI